MNVLEASYRTAIYSQEVNLKASEVAKKYNHTLNKLDELTKLAHSLAEKIEPNIFSEIDKLELKKLTDLMAFLRDEEIENFRSFMEFTNWNIEKSMGFIQDYEDMVGE